MTIKIKGPALSKAQKRRNEVIGEIVNNCGAEANSYAPFKSLVCEAACGIGLDSWCVVVDTPLVDGSRPDVQVWLDVPAVLRSEHEHLFAVVEGKPSDQVKKKSKTIAEEKIPLYRRGMMRYYWQYDAEIVERYELLGIEGIPVPKCWTWTELQAEPTFRDCFGPLMDGNPKLDTILREFENDPTTVKRSDVTNNTTRQQFIQSVVTVARTISRAVTDLVQAHLIPDLKKTLQALDSMGAYGNVSYDWSRSEYLLFDNEPEDKAALREFNQKYTELLEDLQPYEYALRSEKETLPLLASRSDADPSKVSFVKNAKESAAVREAFIQETASLLLSRLLMIRFSEDHGLLMRYISNGGIAAFAKYSEHFKRPYQALVKVAYDNAKPVYKHLFERKTLDWIIDRNDEPFGRSLLHAMWILARWNFQTVRGDILSGVYDKYLEPTQRKRLGEIYTRPELARYLIERCEWTEKKTLLDPACGSGTFLVEAFDLAQQRAEASGIGFDIDDAISLIGKLNGLDINEFSATLAKIQLLWHVLGCVTTDEQGRIREAIRLLKIEGGHSSLDTWGIPMVTDAEYGFEFTEGAVKKRSLKVAERRFRDISTADQQYDVIVGNPPYVRKHRISMSEDVAAEYAEVDHQNTDLSVYFAYRAIRWWLRDGGRLAFFLPFALSESAYADKLRRVLEQYKLVELVDLELLGNSAFHGANIVTMVLIVEKTPSSPDDVVQITTLDEASLEADSGRIDISKAKTSQQKRSDITLSKYLPATNIAAVEEGDDEDEETAGTEWLLKVKSMDVPALEAIAASPRLDSILLYGYERRKKKETLRELQIPEGENETLWKRKAIAGYGVKIGGTLPEIETGMLPVYKGADVFPDGVSGEPMGYWDGSPENVDTVRFYGWDQLVRDKRNHCYAFRQIALNLTAAPHPNDCYLQNTAYLIQLAEDFPLNVYVLSRISSWFMLKLARTSVMSASMRTTWYRRNLLRIPIPANRNADFVTDLRDIGTELFALDQEVVNARNLLDAFIEPDAGLCDRLRDRGDLFEAHTISPIASVSWPEKDADWSNVLAVPTETGIEFRSPTTLFPALPASTASGEPCRIIVSDLKLRRWLNWYANESLASEEIPSAQWLKNAPIPKDIDTALESLDRMEKGQAVIDLQATLTKLDTIVAAALHLSDEYRDYIIQEMSTDPLLSRLLPAWRHAAGRRKIYTAYGDDRQY